MHSSSAPAPSSAHDRYNFLFNTIERLKRGEEICVSDSNVVSPTYVPDLVQSALDLLVDGETGIWHLTNQGAISWHQLAREIADMGRLDRSRISIADDDEPADTSLTSDRGILLRPLEEARSAFVEDARLLT